MKMITRMNCGKQGNKSSWIGMAKNSYSTELNTGMVRGRFPNNPYMALLGKSVYLTFIYVLSGDGRTTI